MTLQKMTDSKSIDFSYINTDKFKTSALTFSFCMPLTERDYLCSLVLAGIMRRGTRSYPSMSLINRRLDELYSSSVDIQSVIHGNVLCFNVSAEMLDSRFALDGTDISSGVIDTIADILMRPLTLNGAFPENTVESEKSFVKDALSAEKNNTKLYAATRLKELMYRDGEIRFPSLKYLLSELDTVTPVELLAYHERLLSSPFRVFYIGAEDQESIYRKINNIFVPIKNNPRSNFKAPTPSEAKEFLSLSEDMPVTQGKLCMGMRTGSVIGNTDNSSAVMLNEIFGASPASKLFVNVRERLGLCYYCSSAYSMLSGNLSVSSGIDISNRDRTVNEILSQLDEIKKGNISDTEFDAAKKSLAYSYVQIYDSPFSLQAFYFVRDLFGINETVEECKERILSVSRDSVSALATKIKYDTCFFVNGTLADAVEVADDE